MRRKHSEKTPYLREVPKIVRIVSKFCRFLKKCEVQCKRTRINSDTVLLGIV